MSPPQPQPTAPHISATPDYVSQPASAESLYESSIAPSEATNRPTAQRSHSIASALTTTTQNTLVSPTTPSTLYNAPSYFANVSDARRPQGGQGTKLVHGREVKITAPQSPPTKTGFSLNRLKPLSKLQSAATKGDLAKVTAALDGGANINERDWTGKTALHRAASAGSVEVAELLLARGADIEAKAAYTQSSLGAHMYGQTLYGNTISGVRALHRAASKGHVEVVNLLLRQGAELEARTSYAQTALHLAAENGCEAVVGLLLLSGAETEVLTGPRDRTPLRLAANGEHEGCMRLILEARRRRGLPPIEQVVDKGMLARSIAPVGMQAD